MKISGIILLLFQSYLTMYAQENAVYGPKQYNLEKGVAMQGYDPVSYFIDIKPREGNKKISATHNSITYFFSSEKNQASFKKDPSKYEPAYGGWCAYAMGAKGEKVEIDPETYKILNGKLYLFYNRFFNNTLTLWNKDEVLLKKNADEYWQKILKSNSVK